MLYKSWMTANLFTTWFTEYFKPTVENQLLRKIDSFQNSTAHWQCTWSPDGDIDNEIVFMAANTASILQPMDQGVLSTFLLFKSDIS